jgi:hypothetical protein
MNNAEPSSRIAIPNRVRALKSNELVTTSDFILNQNKKLEPWEGPSGFQADSFIKPIDREDECRVSANQKNNHRQ